MIALLCRSGKTSLVRTIFHKMSPHETLFLEATGNIDIQYVSDNDFVKFQTWDFGGDCNLQTDVMISGQSVAMEDVFRRSSTLVYVIDAQEEDYEDSLPKLAETISVAHSANPNIHFEVFLHKIDGDIMSEETKGERQQHFQNFVSAELAEVKEDVLVSYYLTSIYDHSSLEAFSKVVQKLVAQLPALNSLMDSLIACSSVDKTFLVDVANKIYIATDSNPVDVRTYELCSDLVDVVLDVSNIYGTSAAAAAAAARDAAAGRPPTRFIPAPVFDENSLSAIRLNSGMVLYLREVGKCLALICVVHEDHFAKRSLLDYNIDVFRDTLKSLLRETSSV